MRGVVADLDALAVGRAAVRLGAGRATKEDDVDPTAGFSALKKPGEAVEPGDVLGRIHARDPSRVEAAREALIGAYSVADDAPERPPSVLGRYGADGWDEA
jgi:pyrimidine-nucleoside phosphorylase